MTCHNVTVNMCEHLDLWAHTHAYIETHQHFNTQAQRRTLLFEC